MNKFRFGVMVVACALAAACSKQGSPPADSLEARIDAHGDEVMASGSKGEARAWMKEPKHVFFKNDPQEIAKFIEDFYSAGATQVLIVDIEEHEGTQYGGSMLVVLPAEAAARVRLFDIGSRVDTALGCDQVTDKGQKYLYYALD